MRPQLQRRQDWPEALSAYIIAALHRPHAWGTHDCVTFARGAVEAATGEAIVLPALWTDEASARAALEAAGGLPAAVDSVLPRLPSPLHAGRGDIVLVRAPGRDPWLAVVFDGLAWAPTPTGLASATIDHAVIAWCVGHG
jgi:hypothetical protein